jgi:predicted alpha-1,2-mannosidase
MKTNHLFVALVALSLAATTVLAASPKKKVTAKQTSLTQYVDPFIGTGGHGHVFLGADVPFGFVQLGPTQVVKGWDWCSGYHASDSILVGFSHTHLSGTGIGDLGDILMFPTTDNSDFSKFMHKNEKCRPGYYSVLLNHSGIKAELTATSRVGFHRYTYPKGKQAKLIVNLFRGIGWDHYQAGKIIQENDTVISGSRISTGWAKHQEMYFTATFSSPIKEVSNEGDTVSVLTFKLPASGKLLVKVALSPVSIENAKMNMKAELPGWQFDATAIAANKAWEKQLNAINFRSSNASDMKIFYTALYHTMIAPSLFCDVNGDYYGSDKKIHRLSNFKNYTTFSLWDTYRAAHPLFTLIHRDMMNDISETFLHIFAQQGKLPVWHLVGNETDCMVGNPGIPVLADMVLKGAKVDKEAAFDAMKKSAMLDERGLKALKEYGYIPYDKGGIEETVSVALEYSLADWCVAQLAKELGKTADYDYFMKRSTNCYTRYFDPATKFMRACKSDGTYRPGFNPFSTYHPAHDYTEGNAWQYTWLVPQDVHGLIHLFGGEKPFLSKLDSLFIVQDTGKDVPDDVSGLIGQYAHGNEPSHHILYLYAFTSQPWKSAPLLRKTLTTLYAAAPDGLSGNEDVGQMSAWYVLSAIGLYQVEPCGGRYIFGSPIMNEATLQVGGGKTFHIVALNNSRDNMYIQSVKLNGAPYTKSYIDYNDIIAGGTLEFTMGNQPSTFGTAEADRP